MNKNSSSVYILLCICLISILITGIYFGEKKEAPTLYTLKEYDGKLAVFSEGEEPLSILDSDIKHFPEKDQTALEEGIGNLTEAELFSLIEDFSG